MCASLPNSSASIPVSIGFQISYDRLQAPGRAALDPREVVRMMVARAGAEVRAPAR